MIKSCSTEGCPFPPDEHFNWCGHQGRKVTHLHWPKKGMGGNNPKSKIVALACWECHDKIDNFGGNIITKDLPGKGLTTWGTDVRGNELFEKRLEAGSAGAEGVSTGGTPSLRSEPQAASHLPSKVNSRIGPSAPAPPASAKSSAGEGGESASALNERAMIASRTQRADKHRSLVPGVESGPSPAEPFSLDKWCTEGMLLVHMGLAFRDATDSVRFAIGDWANKGERILGEEVYGYFRAFRDVTVRQYTWVAGCVAPDTRVELPWTYHRAVAALPAAEQGAWLKKAKDEHLTTGELHRAIHGEKPKPVYGCAHCDFEGTLDLFRRVT